MKYILIGGSGFIGQHFIEKISNDIILNLDINEGVNNCNYHYCNILEKDQLNKIDIRKYKELTLIHLAAVHFDFQKKFFETNVIGTQNVISFIEKNKNIKKYVFFSSVATYGNSNIPINEECIQNPVNRYGESKLQAEKLIIKWCTNNNCDVLIVRPSVVFGEFNFGNVYNLIQQIKSKIFFIVGSGKNIKSIAYAPNLVDSVIFCLKNIKQNLFIYNYSDYPQLNVKNQVKIICDIVQSKLPFKIPLFLTMIFTIPIDIIEKLLNIDLKFNSMRIKKFTVSTHFESDRIRNIGFEQRISVSDAFCNTNKWIDSCNVNYLRNKWYRRASKL